MCVWAGSVTTRSPRRAFVRGGGGGCSGATAAQRDASEEDVEENGPDSQCLRMGMQPPRSPFFKAVVDSIITMAGLVLGFAVYEVNIGM